MGTTLAALADYSYKYGIKVTPSPPYVDCEKKCHFRKTIAQFSHRSDLHDAGLLHLLDLLNHHSGPLCTSAGCFLECFRDQMNRACAHAGGVIMVG